MLVYRSIACRDAVKELFRAVDGIGRRSLDKLLAVEASHLYVLVRRDDDAVRVFDVGCSEHVLCSAGAVRLDLDAYALSCSALLESLGRHVCVGDTGRACRNGYDLRAAGSCRCCRSRFFSLLLCILCFLCIDQSQEFLRRLCCYERLRELFIHQHRHQAREDLEVSVSRACRSRDHEEQVARRSVRASVVDSLRNSDGCETRLLYGIRLCVRNGYSHSNCGRSLLFSGFDRRLVGLLVIEVAYLVVKVHHLRDNRCLVGRLLVEGDPFLFE